jgi:hypothetical protein
VTLARDLAGDLAMDERRDVTKGWEHGIIDIALITGLLTLKLIHNKVLI